MVTLVYASLLPKVQVLILRYPDRFSSYTGRKNYLASRPGVQNRNTHAITEQPLRGDRA